MSRRSGVGALLGLVLLPGTAAASAGEVAELPWWSTLPFILLLFCIALLPLRAPRFWESNRRKGLVVLLLAGPVAGYLVALGGPGTDALLHELGQYISFIVLLASLYTVSGGITLDGDLRATPSANTGILAFGALAANLVGTTGASMLLIRPFLQINRWREHTRHLPVFFIFVVSNLGGLLTPLGDPPLFLGFLNGVPFAWTLGLWPQWLMANSLVLAVFFVCDRVAHTREPKAVLAHEKEARETVRVRGLVNLLFLGGIVAGVVLQSEAVGAACARWLGQFASASTLTLVSPWGELLIAAMALLSLRFTPAGVRAANAFNWEAIVEVAVLFAGIFVTMVPALALLQQHGGAMGVREPWQFFWLAGGLSSVLDNAPTYLTFATLASGPHDFGWLASHEPRVLAAVSTGAVFMGANTYIGNGPNFMVKAIAEAAGFRTPSFFAYMAYAGLVLLPVFGLITFVFFS